MDGQVLLGLEPELPANHANKREWDGKEAVLKPRLLNYSDGRSAGGADRATQARGSRRKNLCPFPSLKCVLIRGKTPFFRSPLRPSYSVVHSFLFPIRVHASPINPHRPCFPTFRLKGYRLSVRHVAKDYSISLVQCPGRAGRQVLYLDFQEIEDPLEQPHVCQIPTGRAGVHRIQRGA